MSKLDELENIAAAARVQAWFHLSPCRNAGIAVTSPALDYTPETWRWTMSTDLDGAFFSVPAFAREMVERGGSVVLMSSVAGLGVVSPDTHAA